MLTFKGEIYSWSLTTGKLLEFHKRCIDNLEDYTTFVSENAEYTYLSLNLQYTLIRSKAIITDISYNDFFHDSVTAVKTPGSVPYHKAKAPYTLHTFKLIEIADASRGNVIREFTWQLYLDGKQDIFFNDDWTMMYEGLKDQRVFLHNWVTTETPGNFKGKF